MATELVNQGIEAYRAGDKDTARRILSEAVEADPNNAKAWYYLAGTQIDVEERRQSLERVLEIMPNNQKAQEALAKLPPRPEPQADPYGFDDLDEVPVQVPTGTVGDDGEFVFNAPPAGNTYAPQSDIPPPTSGFKIPIEIPGAPEFVDGTYLFEQLKQQFMSGIAILQRQPGAYPQEIQRATWWRFWSYVVAIFIFNSLLATLNSLLFPIEVFGVVSRPSLLIAITSFLFTIPLSIIGLYVGVYASHRYMTSQTGRPVPLVNHAYALMLPIVTVNVITAVLGFVPFLGALASIVLFFYALYIAADGIAMVHKSTDSSKYIALVVMIVAQLVVGFILGLILSPFLITASLGAL